MEEGWKKIPEYEAYIVQDQELLRCSYSACKAPTQEQVVRDWEKSENGYVQGYFVGQYAGYYKELD